MTDVGTVTVSSNQVSSPTHYSHLPKDMLKKFEEMVGEFGFTLEELANERNKRIVHNARYMKDRISKIQYRPSKKRTLF